MNVLHMRISQTRAQLLINEFCTYLSLSALILGLEFYLISATTTIFYHLVPSHLQIYIFKILLKFIYTLKFL